MEKFIFFASLKTKLSELNIPQETIEKHIKIFEEVLSGKTSDEVDSIIEGAGGLDGIINSVYKLETAKANKNNNAEKVEPPVEENYDDSVTRLDIPTDISESNKDTSAKEAADETNDTAEEGVSKDGEIAENPDKKSDNIDEHIREAEEITKEIDKVVINEKKNTDDNAEFADDFDEYDFEVLFAEKISKPEKWVMALKSKMSEKTYKNTLPLAILADALLFLIASLLFPLLIISAVVVAVVYIAILILGIAFALVPLGYGAYMSFKIKPIGMYEIALGILVLGFTMLTTILLYNYMKRLVPYLFKKLKELFNLCILVTKRYFAKPKKEEK